MGDENNSNKYNSSDIFSSSMKTRKSQLEQPRVAKKSTTSVPIVESKSVTRRQTRSLLQKEASDKFLDNFDPETSTREKKKLNRRFSTYTARKVAGALYDENGIHIATGEDMCDCLSLSCPGCHFACVKCKSTKCGPDCRVNRKFIYEQIEYHGSDLIIRNPLHNK